MPQCRFCTNTLKHEFIDLIKAPPSNSFLKLEDLSIPETYFPLKLYVCESCLLVQIDEYKAAREIFDSNYVYFSSFSKTWLEHSKQYVQNVTARFSLSKTSKIVEIASNDGYLLQFFKQQGIEPLGIEPTKSTADAATKKGIETLVEFFGENFAQKLATGRGKADLIIANNVLAHVPDVNDFVKGFKTLLSESGVVTVEFPHLLQLVKLRQFDTIYHEHFSYYSLLTICKIFGAHGLRVFDVEELSTHGGSLRVYVDHGAQHPLSEGVAKVLANERKAGMESLSFYQGFQHAADTLKNNFMMFALKAAAEGRTVAAYGAAAKGNTFLNYCGIKKDLLKFVADASPHKQGRYLPGSHIPVTDEATLRQMKPDYVVVLAWNLWPEITSQLSYIREWGGRFVRAVPELEVS